MSLIKITTTITKSYSPISTDGFCSYTTEIKDWCFGNSVIPDSMVLISNDGLRVEVKSLKKDQYGGNRIMASYPADITVYYNVYED